MACENKSCCCKCRYQIRLTICGCEKCPAVVGGYVCDLIGEMNEDGNRVGKWSPYLHGECEMFEKPEK